MAKMTIYVPDDLKGRMDQTEGVSWSPLACQAFESKLAEIINKRGPKNMKDVVNRLRASQQKSDSLVEKLGRADGRLWAMEEAEADELKRLEAEDDAFVGASMEPFEDIADQAYGPGERFYFVVRPDQDGDRAAAMDFWELAVGISGGLDATGEPVEPRDVKQVVFHGPYVQAFAEGALEIWGEVKESL